jgi:hypothetical protein
MSDEVLSQTNIDIISNEPHNNDNIYLISQFYLDSDKLHSNEIKKSLEFNIQSKLFTNIYLLNEKIFTKEEMNLSESEMENIKQININKRLTYSDVLNFVKNNNIIGYIVLANIDIFFDNSINNVRKTSISNKKSFYALSRFEYSETYKNNLDCCKLANIPWYSQDVWIFHTNFLPNDTQIDLCNFELGRVGCDNKIAYLFYSFGFTVYNEPYTVKTYHYHSNQYRNSNQREKYRISKPYLLVYVSERI